MTNFRTKPFRATRVGRFAEHLALRTRLAVPTAIIGMMVVVNAYAQDSGPSNFKLTPISTAVANCLPDASANVTVIPTEDRLGVDTLLLRAQGLPPNTSFTVFLTELPVAPFGAVQYVGEFTTNAKGRAVLRVDTVVDDAFSSTVVGNQRVRKELNHMVIWFADPTDDDVCPGVATVGPFDGDGESGTAVLSSKDLLPGAPLP